MTEGGPDRSGRWARGDAPVDVAVRQHYYALRKPQPQRDKASSNVITVDNSDRTCVKAALSAPAILARQRYPQSIKDFVVISHLSLKRSLTSYNLNRGRLRNGAASSFVGEM
jgi:hypothetical protein